MARSPRFWLASALIVLLCVASVMTSQRTASTMATAANRFLAALTPEQRAQAAFPFDARNRTQWDFTPDARGFTRQGLTIKAMTPPQRTLAHELLETGLSERGYLTATSIIELETLLRVLENNPVMRDPERYHVSIFGAPSDRAWAWRVEGHHLSVNFTIVNGSAVATSPSFFGANPALVRDGPRKGQRVLALLEDSARDLATSLDAAQRKAAVLGTRVPGDLLTDHDSAVSPLSPPGLAAAALTDAQRGLLTKLLDAYAGAMEADLAAERMRRIRAAGLEKVAFAWIGELEVGKRHYYRVQGPTFLIEYDNTQGNGNHIHSVWRDFNGDFGRDLLREHLQTAGHRAP
jgi:hypothetical protein